MQTCEKGTTIAKECNQQEFEIQTFRIEVAEQDSILKMPGSTGLVETNH